MGNERVRLAMLEAGYTAAQLAEKLDVDIKTVERWVNPGRRPYPKTAHLAAALLNADPALLWPSAITRAVGRQPEVRQVYTERAAIPRETWLRFFEGSNRNIDILVFSGTFIAQTIPRIASILAERAEAGTAVRLCFGDPNGAAVRQRGIEEGLGDALGAKVRASLTYFAKLPGVPGCEVRLHDTTLYTSFFRYDDDLLANPHAWGQPASANPVLHLRRGHMFDHYRRSFEAIWDAATPWDPAGASTD